jgi:hypothetical protein
MKISMIIIFCSLLLIGCHKNDNILGIDDAYDYSIDQSISCFCPGDQEPVRIFVRSDSIVDAIAISTKNHLNICERRSYRTIRGLLAEIERWKSDTSLFQVFIEYDSVYNYPSVVSVYPKPVIINDTIVAIINDAGISYRSWNFIGHNMKFYDDI